MKVTIIGSGIVGSCWAVVFGRAGWSVTLYDTDSNRLTMALEATRTKLEQLSQYALLNLTVAQIMQNISVQTDLATALEDSVYVQECVPEVLEIKLSVFAQLDALAPSTAILASSTSNIPASKFTENLPTRQRCLVAHPINPPHVIPLVEVVPTEWTDSSVVNQALEILSGVGQKPVLLKKEVPGFVINRMQYAILAECFRLIEDDVLSVQDVDTSLRYGLAPRWSFMGPIQTIDLNAPEGVKDYCDRYLGGISGLIKQQDNNREFTPEMVEKLAAHQRSLYATDRIPDAIQWRDARLMAQLKHDRECKEIDEKYFPGNTSK
eukprot:TRINITY_DN1352_c0_g1_i2.p1 TRINITY_DN1352_c0_g1~~TRINITY_DN1352_c0_g1_i2.p1  ORF type:complete len:322 (+),score=15.99 TRINITY_DN1352_c0_g1_i2:30-995(+)